MKLIACDKCHAVVPLGTRMRSCKCKNIKGKYTDGRNVLVIVKDKKSSRILGLQNSVRYGLKEKGEAWIIPFDNERVMIKQEDDDGF